MTLGKDSGDCLSARDIAPILLADIIDALREVGGENSRSPIDRPNHSRIEQVMSDAAIHRSLGRMTLHDLVVGGDVTSLLPGSSSA